MIGAQMCRIVRTFQAEVQCGNIENIQKRSGNSGKNTGKVKKGRILSTEKSGNPVTN